MANELLTINDSLEVSIYIGATNEHITKPAKVIKIYEKEKFNMLLCEVETKLKKHYYTCVNQCKINRIVYY